jgi:excisionase family DNA binding protein
MALENTKLVARLQGEILTPREYAEIMRISYPSVMRGIKKGEIPSMKIGNLYRIPRSAVDILATT